MIRLDKNFIKKWEREYKEHDEDEYQKLINILPQEVFNNDLTKETFKRVMKWKWPPIKGKIRKMEEGNQFNFEEYRVIFNQLEKQNNQERLKNLDTIPLIGVPVASVFLHMLWPEEYPIIDHRTVEVLYRFHYINWTTINQVNYWHFKDILYKLKKECNYSLRKIDRALFTYQKYNLDKKKV